VEANIEYVLGAMNKRARSEQIRKAVEIRMKYIKRALQPRPGAINTLTELKNHAYKIGLLSNCSIEIPILWQETAFAHVIDVPTFSSVARLRKPDIRIYRLACGRLGAMPESCLYIADGEDHELAAAAKVGASRADSNTLTRTCSWIASRSQRMAGRHYFYATRGFKSSRCDE
jgi:putative hydrolase of the HAD superfamily